MNAENMNNMKKSERRIFRYTLADAWRDTISQVEVLEGIENKTFDAYILTDRIVSSARAIRMLISFLPPPSARKILG